MAGDQQTLNSQRCLHPRNFGVKSDLIFEDLSPYYEVLEMMH